MSKGSCTFCGEHFDNVFEAVDHLDEKFDPEFIVSNKVRLGLGEMLYKVYSDGGQDLKEWAEEMFSALYIAEKRPEQLEHFLFDHTDSLTRYVYAIVSVDSWIAAGL